MKQVQFPFKKAIVFGFSRAWENLPRVIACSLIFFASSLMVAALMLFSIFRFIIFIPHSFMTSLSLFIGICIAAFFCFSILLLGFFKQMLEIERTGRTSILTLFSCLSVRLGVGYLLYIIMVNVGFAFLLIPGLIFASRFMYFPLCIVDKNEGPIESLQSSWQLTAGYTWINLLFFFVINIVAPGMGILWIFTFPAAILSMIYMYDFLLKHQHTGRKHTHL